MAYRAGLVRLTAMELQVVEHGVGRSGRWLRERRLRLALWIAVAEGVLILVGIVPGWLALVFGAILVLLYVFVGAGSRSFVGRQVTWIAAVSQVLVAAIPILLFVVGFFAILALAIFAAVAIFFLFRDRR